MKCISKIIMGVVGVGTFMGLLAQPTICTWSRGKAGAMSLTFDDQLDGQFTTGVPAMNQRSIRGTIFIFADINTKVKQAALNGHEIASHTTNHNFYETWTTSAITSDMQQHTSMINNAIPSQKCATLAWPGGGGPAAAITIAKKYFIAARNIDSPKETAPVLANPFDMYQIPSLLGTNPDSGTVKTYFSHCISNAEKLSRWTVMTYHNVGSSADGYNDITAASFGIWLDSLKAHEATLWTAPFGEISRYIYERRYGTITAKSSSATQQTYTLSHTLATQFSGATFNIDSMFNVPITLAMSIPSGWKGANVKQSGTAVWCKISGTILLFEAVPNRGDIVVSSEATEVLRPSVRAVIQSRNVTGKALKVVNFTNCKEQGVAIIDKNGSTYSISGSAY